MTFGYFPIKDKYSRRFARLALIGASHAETVISKASNVVGSTQEVFGLEEGGLNWGSLVEVREE